MQSSEWTPDRLQSRIRDHLRWVAAVEAQAAGEALENTSPHPTLSLQPRHWLKAVLRKSVLAMPYGGPGLLKVLRGVKARLRHRFSSPGL